MFHRVSKFLGELDRRIKVLYVFFGVHMWHQNLSSQYKQLYATSLGANPVELGVLESVGSIASSIISMPSGWIADRYGARIVILIGLVLTSVVAAIYTLAWDWWTLLPAILLSGACMRLVLPFVDALFINYSKAHQRSVVMSVSRTLWAIPGIFTSMAAALIVGRFGGITTEGIRPLYIIQLALSIGVLVSTALWLKPPSETSNKKRVDPEVGRGFVRDTRDVFKGERGLTRWIAIMIIREVDMRLSVPFLPLWMVDVKGADPYTLGVMGTAGMVVQMLLQIPAGSLADRIGRKRAFYVFRPFAYLGTLLMIVAPGAEYLVLVGVLGGFGLAGGLGGVSFVPFITMNFEMVPQRKRGRWLGLLGFFGILSFPVSVLGGIMWQQGLMVEVLLLPILLEALVAVPILITVPDTLRRVDIHRES